MNKLEELVNEMCPDGVEYKPLDDIAEFRRGSFPQPYGNSDWYDGDNAMPFVQVADVADNGFCLNNETKQMISQLAQSLSVFAKLGTVIVTLQGTIGKVAITQYDSYVDRTLAIFTNYKVKLNKKYFAYQLKNKFDLEKVNARGSTLKTITKEEFSKFEIPLPPLPIQDEIVRMLDNFTELTTEHTTELTTELVARKKQYEYYRDSLLTFDDEVEWKAIGKCILKTNNIKWKEKQEKQFQYIDLSSVNRDNSQIYETHSISAGTAPSRAQQIVSKDDVLFGSTRPMLKRYCLIPERYNGQICSTGFCVLRANRDVVLPKWLLYLIASKEFYVYVEKHQKGASYPAITDKEIKSYKIPVPSISEQQRIIKILDGFNALCNNISKVLSAEIKARQKQYEYYENRLLTFKKKEVCQDE